MLLKCQYRQGCPKSIEVGELCLKLDSSWENDLEERGLGLKESRQPSMPVHQEQTTLARVFYGKRE